MTINMDDEILQDFLVEAQEILESLGEQLVELEQTPDDNDLLNAVFRGFHTIKGGAGFLELTSMVNICHRAEDIFNLLRQGERKVDAQLMDIILKSLDVVNSMFEELTSGKEPSEAPPELLSQLESLMTDDAEPAADAEKDATEEAAENGADSVLFEPLEQPAGDATDAEFEAMLEDSGNGAKSDSDTADTDEITDDEFESLLDELQGKQEQGGDSSATANSDEINDEEFEELLDKIHGKGKHTVLKAEEKKSEYINEEEFEQLLDKIHGKGKHSGVSRKAGSTANSMAAAGSSANGAIKPPPSKRDPKATEKPQPAKKDDAGKLQASQQETTVRVATKRLDEIMNMVGELVLVRNRLKTLEGARNDEELSKVISSLDVVTGDLQMSAMRTRMQPIKKVFGRFPRVVRDLARSLNKDIKLEMEGEDTDLDKNLVEALADPLVHLVRNSVDHGIETPEVRKAAGKPATGTINLSAIQEGDHILLAIADDGAGMDADVLRQKAVEKGIMDEDSAVRLDDTDCYNLIFAPGFSTKSEISDISGRGVGMDVVKTRISQLNGSINIESEKGKGSTIKIKVPLTLAIMPTLMVMLSNHIFALPLVNVSEIFNLDLSKTNVVDGKLVVQVRGKSIPLFYLREWLIPYDESPLDKSAGFVVIVNIGTRHMGFVVDQLIGQEEVVIKPLGALLQGVSGLAGATITGDGRISLILDIPGLTSSYARSM